MCTAALLQMLTTRGLKWNNTLTYYNSLLLLLLTKQFLRLCFGQMTLIWMGMRTASSSDWTALLQREHLSTVRIWLKRSLSPPLCLKEFSLERTSGELRPLSLRCGDEGSLSPETSGSGSLSVMQGVMLCCLFRASGEVTPWAKRGRHWNAQTYCTPSAHGFLFQRLKRAKCLVWPSWEITTLIIDIRSGNATWHIT